LIAVRHAVSFSEPKSDKSRRLLALDSTTPAALKAHRAPGLFLVAKSCEQ